MGCAPSRCEVEASSCELFKDELLNTEFERNEVLMGLHNTTHDTDFCTAYVNAANLACRHIRMLILCLACLEKVEQQQTRMPSPRPSGSHTRSAAQTAVARGTDDDDDDVRRVRRGLLRQAELMYRFFLALSKLYTDTNFSSYFQEEFRNFYKSVVCAHRQLASFNAELAHVREDLRFRRPIRIENIRVSVSRATNSSVQVGLVNINIQHAFSRGSSVGFGH